MVLCFKIMSYLDVLYDRFSISGGCKVVQLNTHALNSLGNFYTFEEVVFEHSNLFIVHEPYICIWDSLHEYFEICFL